MSEVDGRWTMTQGSRGICWHLPEGVKCLNLVSAEGIPGFIPSLGSISISTTPSCHQLNQLRFIVMAFGTHPDSYAAVYSFCPEFSDSNYISDFHLVSRGVCVIFEPGVQ